MRLGVLLATTVAVALAGCGAEQQQRRTEPRAASLTDHLAALDRIAREHGNTRAAGTRGDRATADYIARQLRAAGYRVRFQAVRFPYFDERSPSRIEGLRRRDDFATARYSAPGRVSARVTATDTLGCDQQQLAAVDEGDIALVRRGTCTFRVKAEQAQRAAAAALLIVDPDEDRPLPASLGRPGVDIPVLSVAAGAVDELAGATIDLRVDTVSERRTSRNVIAEPARGRAAKVMAGAHLDSVPEGPGLNDNASGIAALLDIARRRPRGVSFGFWAAEEIGLIGSRRYVRETKPELDAYLNLDMVGTPGGRLREYGDEEVLEAVDLPRRAGLGGASDHAAFQSAGIPAGGIFTGLDRCYHRACDRLRNVDERVLRRSVRAASAALRALAR